MVTTVILRVDSVAQELVPSPQARRGWPPAGCSSSRQRMSIDSATLASLLRPYLGATPAATFTPIGTGKHNASYWVQCADRGFVLRPAPPVDVGFLFYEQRMMRQEPALHALIRARTAIPVAEVIAQ